MTVRVRGFRPEDAGHVAEVRRAAVPHLVCTGEAVAWAADYIRAFTGNDADSAPMLAVNTRLGYRPAGAEWALLRAPGRALTAGQ